MTDLSIAWQLVLSAFIPVILAILLLAMETHGPLAGPIQACKGVVGPYFNAIAIVFGLYAALMASDAWQKDSQARRVVSNEVNAAWMISQTARALDVSAYVLPKLKAYVELSGNEREGSRTINADRDKTEKAFAELLNALAHAPNLGSATRALLISESHTMMRAHDDRAYLADRETMPYKRLAIIIFGFLTQIAIMLVHVGYRRATRVSVALFTVTFSACLMFAAIFDSPFKTLIPDEPKASMASLMQTL